MTESLGSVLTATTGLLGVCGILTWAELYVLETRIAGASRSRLALAVNAFFLAGSVLAIAGASSPWRVVPVAVIAVGCIAFVTASAALRDGADDMLLITACAALAALCTTSEDAQRVALLFIAGQLLLAYAIAGVAKLAGGRWRSGSAVVDVLATADFGRISPSLIRVDGVVARLLAWGTIGVELALPVLFMLGGPLILPAVFVGAGFHVGIAVMIGLNRFLPAFLATYPAAAFCSAHYGLLS